MERTEEQKLTQAPITVILGGKEYEIKPLVIRDSRPWRAKIIKLIAALPSILGTTSDNPEKFDSALTQLMITMPDQVLDLFFEYAKDLKREEIEACATETEVATAFGQIMEVALPLTQSLPAAMGRLSR